jgi:hypothetical protein
VDGQNQIAILRRPIGKLQVEEKKLLQLKYAEEVSRELYRDEQKRIMDGIYGAETQIERLQVVDHGLRGAVRQGVRGDRQLP